MAIRTSTEETLVVDGGREEWIDKCQLALNRQGFRSVEVVRGLGQLHASYKRLTTWGSIDITLRRLEEDTTKMHVNVTANVDNIYALFRSSTKKILSTFKSGFEFEDNG